MANISDKKFYWTVGIFIFLLVAFLGYQDTVGLGMFSVVGGYNTEVHLAMDDLYMQLFWSFSLVITMVASFFIYIFRKDISEAIAVFVGSWIVLLGGAEDVAIYWWLGNPGLPASMPWLYDITIGWTSKYLLGLETVTPLGLYLQLGISIVIASCVVRWLRKNNNKYFGVKI